MDAGYEPCCSDGQDYVRWGELDCWYEPGSLKEYQKIVQLGNDYGQWFEKLTGTVRGDTIIGWYNRDWEKMHDELFVFYRHEMDPEKTVDDHWNPEKIESLMKKS